MREYNQNQPDVGTLATGFMIFMELVAIFI